LEGLFFGKTYCKRKKMVLADGMDINSKVELLFVPGRSLSKNVAVVVLKRAAHEGAEGSRVPNNLEVGQGMAKGRHDGAVDLSWRWFGQKGGQTGKKSGISIYFLIFIGSDAGLALCCLRGCSSPFVTLGAKNGDGSVASEGGVDLTGIKETPEIGDACWRDLGKGGFGEVKGRPGLARGMGRRYS